MNAELRAQIASHGGLYSISDLAARWGISRQRVRILAQHDGFPTPLVTAGGQSLWLADEADTYRRCQILRGEVAQANR